MPSPRTLRPEPHSIVVGASSGAGLACVRALARAGYRVSAIARTPPSARLSRRVRYWPTDLHDPMAVKTALREILGRGGQPSSLFFFQRFRGPGDTWRGEIEITLEATRMVIDTLVADHDLRDAAIVVISSVNATLISPQVPLSYHLAKAGLNQLVRFYAVTLGPLGIRVNSVSPGTFLKDESRARVLADHRLVRLYKKIIPLRRMCTVEEVVATARFLASPASSFISGQDLIVDGGLSLVFQEALARDLINADLSSGTPAQP